MQAHSECKYCGCHYALKEKPKEILTTEETIAKLSIILQDAYMRGANTNESYDILKIIESFKKERVL